MSDYGIKVSKTGQDVSSTAPTNFIMHSDFATIKVLSSGLGTIGIPTSGTVSGTVTHNTGFYPLVLVYAKLTPADNNWFAAPFNNIGSANSYFSNDIYSSYVGTASFVFKAINNTASSINVPYKYYVIGETGV